jgi:hypothetical protein
MTIQRNQTPKKKSAGFQHAVGVSVGALILFLLVIPALVAILTMVAWNASMPHIFGLPQLAYTHALGLTILANILVKSVSRGKDAS